MLYCLAFLHYLHDFLLYISGFATTNPEIQATHSTLLQNSLRLLPLPST
jgi:hypothetical protein